jgi:TRAP-type C4-dicarboxylate transport system permease small subunit
VAAEATDSARPADPVGRVLYRVAWALAVIGGVLVCGMAGLTTVSVFGRSLFAAPVPGDYEIVGVLNGVAIFAFLPYCQLMGGNVIVDFFTTGASRRVKGLLDAVGSAVYLAIAALLTWRLYYGAIDMHRYNEVTTTVGFPRWTTFPLAIFCMAVLLLVTLYTTWRSLRTAQPAPAISHEEV